jgi:hypothetical protein
VRSSYEQLACPRWIAVDAYVPVGDLGGKLAQRWDERGGGKVPDLPVLLGEFVDVLAQAGAALEG